MIVSWAIDVGGALLTSARNAVHASFFDVARIRAEPLLMEPPARLELIESPAAALVPNITVAPGPTLSEVAAASLAGAPPAGEKRSEPALNVPGAGRVEGQIGPEAC